MYIIDKARSLETSASELSKLAENPDYEVQWRVAENPNTPLETRCKLAKEGISKVKLNCLEYFPHNEEIEKILMYDTLPLIRAQVARMTKSESRVMFLSGDPDWLVRENSIRNENFYFKCFLMECLSDNSQAVRDAAWKRLSKKHKLIMSIKKFFNRL